MIWLSIRWSDARRWSAGLLCSFFRSRARLFSIVQIASYNSFTAVLVEEGVSAVLRDLPQLVVQRLDGGGVDDLA